MQEKHQNILLEIEWSLLGHIVSFEKFHKIGGAPPETFPNVKYDAPEEVSGNRKGFNSFIRK